MKIKPKLLFTDASLPLILEALGKTTTRSGYVIDAGNKEYVLDADGKKFKSKNLLGIFHQQWITSFEQVERIIIDADFQYL